MNWKNKAFIKLREENDELYVDIFEEYGVSFIKGTYEKLLEYPSLKSLLVWDDRREHGVKYLANPDTMRYDKKQVSIEVILEGSDESDYYEKYEAFFKKITSGVICIKIPSIKRIFKLVYNRVSNLTKFDARTSKFALSMIEENPNDRE